MTEDTLTIAAKTAEEITALIATCRRQMASPRYASMFAAKGGTDDIDINLRLAETFVTVSAMADPTPSTTNSCLTAATMFVIEASNAVDFVVEKTEDYISDIDFGYDD